MPLLNKEKMVNGFGKAVDALNNTADKAACYAKEKEWDKKIEGAADSLAKGAKEIGRNLKETFTGK